MTNFEKITSSVQALSEFLYRVQDDALDANGCSMYLKMPDPEICMLWDRWLEQEVRNE